MEELSRRLLQALFCGAVGPLVAWVALRALAPLVLEQTISEPDLGSVIAGVFWAGLVLMPLVTAGVRLGFDYLPRRSPAADPVG